MRGAVNKILLDPDPILRTPCTLVAEDQDIAQLIADLWATCAYHNGRGLSAPQIGVSLRVAVVMPDILLVNPTAVRYGRDKVVMREGCLSIPGRWAEIARPKLVTIQSLDRRYNLRGWESRCAQHEMNHLDGILMIDLPGRAEGAAA